jgi:hypothetical protein
MSIKLSVLFLLLLPACNKHELIIFHPDYASKKEILLAVQKIKIGMSADNMLSCLIPVCNGTPAIRFLPMESSSQKAVSSSKCNGDYFFIF